MPSVAEIHEVIQKGGFRSACRTGDQTAAAIFWATAPIATWWNAVRAVIAAERLNGGEAREALAALGQATLEARKRAARLAQRSRAPRPFEVISGSAPSKVWPRTVQPDWRPLVECPATSEFPCEACMAGGAAVGWLRANLDVEQVDLLVAHPNLGLTRRFTSLSEMLQESEDARVWSGWHFRSTAVESTERGLALVAAPPRGRAGSGDNPAHGFPQSRHRQAGRGRPQAPTEGNPRLDGRGRPRR